MRIRTYKNTQTHIYVCDSLTTQTSQTLLSVNGLLEVIAAL